ncbi:DNA damage-inducible protein D [Zhihengliuella halotolerans]|uniref:DNA damage-inducible protein D n=1 Tax=Zhihengliuella halotolerans TaxID=370736 RepID=UPI001CA4A23F|nr:DNA damage-inducible protein D [Zhihengliuella halotolerans]
MDEVRKAGQEDEHEFWFARDLMLVLGYKNWESFARVVIKAQEACATAGLSEDNHFRQATKKVRLGSSASREVEDVMLSRFACYLVAQNGDPKKQQIAMAQAYFAVQTRKSELIEERYRSIERLEHREQLKVSEKALSDVFSSHGVDGKGYAIIRSKGDQAFFGGHTTQMMKDKYGIQKSRPLGDFLSPLALSAKTLVNEMSRHNISRSELHGAGPLAAEHVSNSESVRSMLQERGIKPEDLPAEEDIRKVQRRVSRDHDALPSRQLPETTE